MDKFRKWIGYESDVDDIPYPTIITKHLYNGICELKTNISNDKNADSYINQNNLVHINFSIKYVPDDDHKHAYGKYLKEIIISYFNQDACGKVNVSYLWATTDYSLGITTFYIYIKIPIIPESNNNEVNLLHINNVWELYPDRYFGGIHNKNTYEIEVPLYGKNQNVRIPVFGEILDWRLLSNSPLVLLAVENNSIKDQIRYWKGLFLVPISDNSNIRSLEVTDIEDIKERVRGLSLNGVFTVKVHVTMNKDYKIISELCEMFNYQIISRLKIDQYEWVAIKCPSNIEYATNRFFKDALANMIDDRPVTVYYNCQECNSNTSAYVRSKYALEMANYEVLGGKYRDYVDVLSSGTLTFPAFSHIHFQMMIEKFKHYYDQDLELNFNHKVHKEGWYPVMCDGKVFSWVRSSNEPLKLDDDSLFDEVEGLVNMGKVSESKNGIVINYNTLEDNYIYYKPNGSAKDWRNGTYISIWGREYYNLTKKVSAIVTL